MTTTKYHTAKITKYFTNNELVLVTVLYINAETGYYPRVRFEGPIEKNIHVNDEVSNYNSPEYIATQEEVDSFLATVPKSVNVIVIR